MNRALQTGSITTYDPDQGITAIEITIPTTYQHCVSYVITDETPGGDELIRDMNKLVGTFVDQLFNKELADEEAEFKISIMEANREKWDDVS